MSESGRVIPSVCHLRDLQVWVNWSSCVYVWFDLYGLTFIIKQTLRYHGYSVFRYYHFPVCPCRIRPLGGSEQRRCKFSQLGYRRQSRQIQDNHYNSLSRSVCRSRHEQRYDGNSTPRHIQARTLLLLRPHMHIHGSDCDRHHTPRHIQLSGHAHIHHRVDGVRATRRSIRDSPDKDVGR